MPSTKPKIVIYTDKETIEKLDIIANNENRSRANIAETIIKNYIKSFEEKHGNISIHSIQHNETVNIISGGNNNIDIK